MRKVALRGLFARKLRLALTVLAVVLGDDADRRHLRLHRLDQQRLRHDLHGVQQGHRRGDHAAQDDRHEQQRRHGAHRPRPPCWTRSASSRAWRPPRARSSTPARSWATTASASARAAAPNFLASVADVPRFQGFTLKTGPQAAERRRGGDRRGDGRRRRAGSSATRSAPSRTAPRKCYTLVGHDPDRRPELVRRRRGRSTSCCPRPSGCSARATASTRSRSPPSRA